MNQEKWKIINISKTKNKYSNIYIEKNNKKVCALEIYYNFAKKLKLQDYITIEELLNNMMPDNKTDFLLSVSNIEEEINEQLRRIFKRENIWYCKINANSVDLLFRNKKTIEELQSALNIKNANIISNKLSILNFNDEKSFTVKMQPQKFLDKLNKIIL